MFLIFIHTYMYIPCVCTLRGVHENGPLKFPAVGTIIEPEPQLLVLESTTVFLLRC